MLTGIENLATGFLQGLNAKKQQERQDVIDQREAERFDMQKQQFADQQAANQLSMKTNQFQLGQAQAKAERDRILQEKEDNFRKQWEGFARPFAMGNDQEGYNALEKTYNDLGYMGKGAFKRDAQGNVLLDDKGNITFLTYGADGKPTSKSLNKDQMIEGFINSYDPVKHWEYEQKTKAEIAKEQRQLNNQIKLSGIQTDNAIRSKKESERFTPHSLTFVNTENGTFGINPITGKVIEIKTPEGKPMIKSSKSNLSDKDYEPYLPLAQKFSSSKLTSQQLRDTVSKLTKEEFINSGLQNFKANNVGKFMRPSEMKEIEQALNGLADNLYGANGVTQSTSGGQQNTLTSWIKSQNITNENQAADTIRTLREKGWSDDQINASFDELGL